MYPGFYLKNPESSSVTQYMNISIKLFNGVTCKMRDDSNFDSYARKSPSKIHGKVVTRKYMFELFLYTDTGTKI